MVRRDKIPSTLPRTRLSQFLAKFREYLTSGTPETPGDLTRAIQTLFEQYYIELDRAQVEPLIIDPNQYRDVEQLKHYLRALYDDLYALFVDTGALSSSIVDAVNYINSSNVGLKGRSDALSASLVDLNLAADIPNEQVFIAGDDFSSNDYIDTNFPLSTVRAFRSPFGRTVSLSPQTALNLSEAGAVQVVRVEGPQPAARSSGTFVGKYYAYLGEMLTGSGEIPRFIKYVAIPQAAQGEAASTHASLAARWSSVALNEFNQNDSITSVTQPTQEELRTLIMDLRDDPDYITGRRLFGGDAGTFLTLDELELLAANIASEFPGSFVFPYSSFSGDLPDTATTFYRPATPSKSQLDVSYTSAVDGDPVSYLRLENNITTDNGWGLGDPGESPEEFSNMLRASIDTDALTGNLENSSGDAPASSTFTITLGLGTEPVTINWLTLLPYQESSASWIEVGSIEYSSTDDSPGSYQQIPGMGEDLYDNVLTDQVNAELTSGEQVATLAGSASSYTGIGLWVFQPIQAKYLRFTLTQRTITPAPYERVLLRLRREIEMRRRTVTRIFGVATNVSRSTTTEVEHLELLLPYEEGVLITQQAAQQLTPEEQSSITGAGVGALQSNNTNINSLLFINTRTTINTTASAWEIEDQEAQVQFDRARHVVGIREIGIHSYVYEESSELVSVPYSTPGPIDKVVLHVTEFIPQSLKDIDSNRVWLTYEVSFDGSTWYPIAPLGPLPELDALGLTIPQVLNINSPVPSEFRNPNEGYVVVTGDARRVRLRAKFSRPAEDNAISPVLKSYRLALNTRL